MDPTTTYDGPYYLGTIDLIVFCMVIDNVCEIWVYIYAESGIASA